MDLDRVIVRLRRNRSMFEHLLGDVEDGHALVRPEPGKWNLLEVVNHLLDEERLDFRARIDLLVRRPGEPWPPIDPEGWVVAHGYAERDYAESVSAFLGERDQSLAWLTALEEPDWSGSYAHAQFGDLRAGDLLASWLVHDYLHLRQIARIQASIVADLVPGFSPAYAGPW